MAPAQPSLSPQHTCPFVICVFGGAGGWDKACLCTHHQVQEVLRLSGSPKPFPGPSPILPTPMPLLEPHPLPDVDIHKPVRSLLAPPPSPGLHYADPASGPLRVNRPLYPSGCSYNGGAHPVFEGSRHDCLPCAEPEGQQGGQPTLVAAWPPQPCCLSRWPSLSPGQQEECACPHPRGRP